MVFRAATDLAAAHEMIVHQLANTVRVKVSPFEGAWLEQNHQHVFEFVAHPVDEGQGESLLLAVDRFVGNANAFG